MTWPPGDDQNRALASDISRLITEVGRLLERHDELDRERASLVATLVTRATALSEREVGAQQPSRTQKRPGRPKGTKGNYRRAVVKMAEFLASGQVRTRTAAAAEVIKTKTAGNVVSTKTLVNEFNDNFENARDLILSKVLAIKDPGLFRGVHDEAVKNFLATGDIFPEQEVLFERLMQMPPERWAPPNPKGVEMARLIREAADEIRDKIENMEKNR